MQIDDTRNGGEVEVRLGATFKLRLPENPTTGFRWHLVSSGEPSTALLEESFLPQSTAPGASGVHRWRFQAEQGGTATIRLALRRRWQEDAAPDQMFEVRVRVLLDTSSSP